VCFRQQGAEKKPRFGSLKVKLMLAETGLEDSFSSAADAPPR
jgi:hypothetical protein